MAELIETLKQGDSITHKKPYEGEGEKIVAIKNIPEIPGHSAVIFALCTKHPGLNGLLEYMSHDVINTYYRKVG